MSQRKIKVTREFFINHYGNWLPEHESEGRIGFYAGTGFHNTRP